MTIKEFEVDIFIEALEARADIRRAEINRLNFTKGRSYSKNSPLTQGGKYCNHYKTRTHNTHECRALQTRHQQSELSSGIPRHADEPADVTANRNTLENQPFLAHMAVAQKETTNPYKKDISLSTVAVAPATLASQPVVSLPWLLDTCVSYHVTGDKPLLDDFTGDTVVSPVAPIAGPPLSMAGTGHLLLDADGIRINIPSVNFAPGAKANILSFAHLESQGYKFRLLEGVSPPYCIINTPDGDVIKAHRSPHNNVYIMGDITSNSCDDSYRRPATLMKSCIFTSPQETVPDPVYPPNFVRSTRPQSGCHNLVDWHLILGHLHPDAIIALSKSKALNFRISGSKSTSRWFCSDCVKANMKRKHPRQPMPRATRPFQRVYIDMAGGGRTVGGEHTSDDDPSFLSRQHHRYFLLITDDATRYRWVYFLERKSDAVQSYAFWTSHIVNLGFKPAAFVRSDVDGVFRGSAMQKLFLNNGTVLEATAIDLPWQDGVTERGIGILMSRTRSVVLSSKVPQKFWSDILLHVV